METFFPGGVCQSDEVDAHAAHGLVWLKAHLVQVGRGGGAAAAGCDRLIFLDIMQPDTLSVHVRLA